MKLKPIKYNIAVGLITLVPMLTSCDDDCVERGVILQKDKKQLFVDVNGDNKADRVLQITRGYDAESFYNYAQPGDSIVYRNDNRQQYVACQNRSYIKSINKKTLRQVFNWQAFAKNCQAKGMEYTR